MLAITERLSGKCTAPFEFFS
uniref:Uncharacterized protein n=1 Tax=Arundo donax TaxID=35708 RepID=A0A0A9CFS6_ARUDO